MERKKILISCNSPRSLLAFRGKLIERLIEKYEVCIFAPAIEQSMRYRLIGMGVKICENQLKPGTVSVLSDLSYMLRLLRLIRKLKPDIFFPYTFKPVIYGVLVARYCKIKSIVPMLTGLGYNFSFTSRKTNAVQKITRILLKFSLRSRRYRNLRLILQNKDDYHTLLAENIITRKNRVFVVNGSGVDLSYYKYSAPDLKRINFLMISRLISAKGIREYYEAAKLMKVRFPELNFKLIGAYEDNIDAIDPELYEKIRYDGVVQYFGLVEDVRPYISASSVVVLPSYYGEGVPRCILEGMAMGRAIITTDSVGCRETINPVKKQINGFLIPVRDIQGLISKMEHYVKHPADITRFGLNSRKYAMEKFEVTKVNEQMVSILEDTAG